MPINELKNELSILVLSCDHYSELWDPHFHFLFKYWPELNSEYKNVPIYLLSNNQEFTHDRVLTIKSGKDVSWSDNLMLALKQINSKYVMILLEDYIINQPVNHNRIEELLTVLEKNDAAYVKLMRDQGIYLYNFEPNKYFLQGSDTITYRSKDIDSKFINSLQAALWNKKALESLLVKSESAWDFEIIGNDRARLMKNPFFDLVGDPAMSYMNAVQKRMYEQEAIDFIREQGYDFKPQKLPVYPRDEITKKVNNPNYKMPSGKSYNYN